MDKIRKKRFKKNALVLGTAFAMASAVAGGVLAGHHEHPPCSPTIHCGASGCDASGCDASGCDASDAEQDCAGA